MRKFRVTCGYRRDNGMTYDFSTHRDTVTVEALDGHAACSVAIDAMYAKHLGRCSHVYPIKVEEV